MDDATQPDEAERWDVATGVGLTALAAAAARALETHRDGAWTVDPYAEAFVHAARPPQPMPTRPDQLDGVEDAEFWGTISLYLATRTRYVDEFLAAATAAGLRQVVLLAAGLDSRAQRLAWPPGTTVHEIDQRGVLEFKRAVFADLGVGPRCAHREIGIDLRDDWPSALLKAGFDTRSPTAWVAEGLVSYLGADAQERLLAGVVGCSAHGSQMQIPSPIPDAERAIVRTPHRFTATLGADVRAMISTDQRPSPATWLHHHGWHVDVESVADVAAAWGRPPAAGNRPSDTSGSGLAFPATEFVTARR